MGNSRRIAAVGLTAVLAALSVSGSASAQTAETFAGSAAAQAFELSAFGQGFVLGASTAAGSSLPEATATGTGQLNPLAESTVSTSKATGPEQSQDAEEACDLFNLSEQLAPLGISLALACGDSAASTLGGLAVASADGSAADVGIGADTLLDTIPVAEPVGDAVDSVFEGLQPIFDLDPALQDVGTTLQDIIRGVLETQTLAISVGSSASSFTTTATAATAQADASGVVIDILPQGAVNLETQAVEPVAKVIVGAASATASYDRVAGTTSTAVEPALVRVVISEAVATALQLPENEIAVTPGQSRCIPLPDPLEICIVAAAGEEFTTEDGGVGARASAVRVELFTGLGEATGAGEGGIVLSLAEAEAIIQGAPAVAATPAPAAELPRTGGTPVVPLAGAGLLALAVVGGRAALAARPGPSRTGA